MSRTRRCVIDALHRVKKQTNCSREGIESTFTCSYRILFHLANIRLFSEVSISSLDECYKKDVTLILYQEQNSHQGKYLNLFYLLLIRRISVNAMDDDIFAKAVWFTLTRSSVVTYLKYLNQEDKIIHPLFSARSQSNQSHEGVENCGENC